MCVFFFLNIILCSASDGQCMVWEMPTTLTHTPDGPQFMLPLARIKESLGSGIARADVVFDSESNTLNICFNERKIRYASKSMAYYNCDLF